MLNAQNCTAHCYYRTRALKYILRCLDVYTAQTVSITLPAFYTPPACLAVDRTRPVLAQGATATPDVARPLGLIRRAAMIPTIPFLLHFLLSPRPTRMTTTPVAMERCPCRCRMHTKSSATTAWPPTACRCVARYPVPSSPSSVV